MLKYLCFTLLIVLARPLWASEHFYDLLKDADEIKSSDALQFNSMLDDLSANANDMSQRDKDFLNFLKAYQSFYAGDLEKAESIYKSLGANSNSVIQLRSKAALVNMYAFTHDWEQGLNTIMDMTPLLDNPSLPKEYFHPAIFAMALFYNQIGDHRAALKHSNALLNDAPTPRNDCLGRVSKLEALQGLSLIDKNQSLIFESLTVCEQAKEPVPVGAITGYLATMHIGNGEPKKAITLLQEALPTALSTNYATHLAVFFSQLAEASLLTNDMENARNFALKTVELIDQGAYKPSFISALNTLYKVERSLGNYDKALERYIQFTEIDRAYLDSIKARELAIQQVKHDALQKNNQIELLDKENELLKFEAELAIKGAENDRLALALISILVFLLFLWIYRSRRLQIKLRHMAETDELTGISNRHHFNELASNSLRHHQHHHQSVSFILFDLDHFKKINDNFGHQTGDWALKSAVDAARSVCRTNDVLGRMGGEEFAVLLPGCNISKAEQIAELCRGAIENIDSSPSGEDFKITASFGVSDAETCGYHFDKLFAGADAALYRSKDLGRNQVYKYNLEQLALNV